MTDTFPASSAALTSRYQSKTMNIIPVLDLMEGQVVRGVAGRRESYAPIQSTFVDSSDPLDVAHAFRKEWGFHRLYVADLDAITNDRPHWSVLEKLASDGFELLVDAGLRGSERALRLLNGGVSHIVAALETLPGPDVLQELLTHAGPERLVFSLDLMQGRPLGNLSSWGTCEAESIARRAIALGVTSLIVLDLSAVGVDGGVPTLPLCKGLKAEHPQVRLISGGGIRSSSDLRTMCENGVDGALIASALHDRRITPADVHEMTNK